MKRNLVIMLTIFVLLIGLTMKDGATVSAATMTVGQDGISYSGPILSNEVTGSVFTKYEDWPSDFTNGSSAFAGGVYDGTNIWLIPYNADRLVKVNPTTGEMTGYSNWPAGFTKGSNAFAGGVYDGTYIWLIPYSASQVIKVDPTTGEMTGYSNWPDGSKGSDQFIGGAFDGTNIWLTPYVGSRLIKLDPTNGAMTSYNSWPSGSSLGSSPFLGSVFDGTSIWLIPSGADRLIQVNPATGEMTGYTNWPSGFTKSSEAFWGGVFDGANIWLIPSNATHVIKVDTATGEMTGYNGWPSGFTKGSSAFAGGVFDGTNIWLIPSNANRLVKVNPTTGEMTGYNNWPSGFTKGNSAFFGGVYDGANVWMVPFAASSLLKFGASADLSNLIFNEGTISPAFDAKQTSYTMSVENRVTQMDVTPIMADATATITINGTAVGGNQAHTLELNEGKNLVNIVVTAGDGQTKAYTVTITRANSIPTPVSVNLNDIALSEGTLSPIFDAQQTNYAVNVANYVTSLDVTPLTTDSTATITINGTAVGGNQAHTLELNEGKNLVNIVVTAGDGQMKAYTVTITRATQLPLNSTITPTLITVDKAMNYQDIQVQFNLAGNEFQELTMGPTILTLNQYRISPTGEGIFLNRELIAMLNPGTYSFTVKFSAGNSATLTLQVVDSTTFNPPSEPSIPIDSSVPSTPMPTNSSIESSTTVNYELDRTTGYQDLLIRFNLAGNMLQQIEIDNQILSIEDYEINSAEGTVRLKKEFLQTLAVGAHRIVFKFNAGADALLELIMPEIEQETVPESMITFSDMKKEFWAYESIQRFVEKGIILGYPNNEFRPDESIRREHMVLMISRLGLLKPKREVATFVDVADSYVYYDVIRLAQLAGIIDGNEGKFNSKSPLTRAQIAKVLVLLFDFETTNSQYFTDVPDSAWYAIYVNTLAAKGIVLGDDGHFMPMKK